MEIGIKHKKHDEVIGFNLKNDDVFNFLENSKKIYKVIEIYVVDDYDDNILITYQSLKNNKIYKNIIIPNNTLIEKH